MCETKSLAARKTQLTTKIRMRRQLFSLIFCVSNGRTAARRDIDGRRSIRVERENDVLMKPQMEKDRNACLSVVSERLFRAL